MKHVLPFVLLFTVLAPCQSTTRTAPKNAAVKKTGSSETGSAKKTGSGAAASARKGRSSGKSSKTASKSVKRAPAAARQMQPTPERYKEIQQALVDKGYLKSAPNGVWDAESSTALAQFQNDRKLPPTGKLTAASLIGLGLGSGAAPAPPPPESAADPASHTTGAN